MKELDMLVWLTQLGLGVAVPLAGFVYLSIWLRERFGLGAWVNICGIVLGLIGAASSLRSSLKMMEQMAKGRKKPEPPPVSFNKHD